MNANFDPQQHDDLTLDPTIERPLPGSSDDAASMLNPYGETVSLCITGRTDNDEHAVDTPVPETLGRYQVRDRLGKGGFGDVYRAYDDQLRREVAIKVPRAFEDSEKAARRLAALLEEARSLARLKHPGIVTVLEVVSDSDLCMIVSEFLDGPNLNEWMFGRTVSWQQSVELTAHIADALAFAHSQSTVHRDLKPANIILVERADGLRPVLVDFGLAINESAPDRGRVGVVAGTPNYMSPEQARGHGHRIDGRTDIYALGIILYRMLSGALPFVAPSVSEVLRQVQEDVPAPPRRLNRDIPAEAERICLKAMAREINERYTTAADLALDLRAMLARQSNEIAETIEIRPVTRAPVRRQVSVLVCRTNLLELPAFVEQLEPEEQHDVLLDIQQTCDEAASKLGGTVSQFDIDRTTICFGYPTAHEDDGRRAARTGLTILAGLAELASVLKASHGIEFSAYGTVHTADAVMQENVAAGLHGLTLIGEARHVAEHLDPGFDNFALAVTDSTARLLEGWFECEPVGEQAVLGAGRDIKLHRVAREGTARSRIDIAESSGLTPLVGRDTEKAILEDLWEQAADGLGQVVCVIGEAGLGKSRLIREATQHVTIESDAMVIEWRASPYFSNSSLHPAVDWFARTLGLDAEESTERRLELLVEHLAQHSVTDEQAITLIAQTLSIPTEDCFPPLALSPLRLMEKTIDALLLVLERYVAQRPVLFVVEDLHWIDPTTLSLLSRLVDEGVDDRMLTVLTFRPEFETPWGSRPHQTQIALNRLTAKQIEEMIRLRLDLAEIDSGVVEQITNRTEGVPLFIEEYSRLIQESGALTLENGKVRLTEDFSLDSIPSTLRDLLVSRLDRMQSAHDVAQIGALIGRRFSWDLIQAVTRLDRSSLRRELDKLISAEILFRENSHGQKQFIFKHALIQDAASDSLLKNQAIAFHGRIAATLEASFPDIAETEPERLAHHFTQAGEERKAIDYWLRAGTRAQMQMANAEAISHLETGLDLVCRLDDSADREALEMSYRTPLIACLMGARGYAAPEIEPHHKRVQEIGLKSGDAMTIGQLFQQFWQWTFIRGDHERSVATTDRLRENAEASGDAGLLTEANWSTGCAAFFTGRFTDTVHYERLVQETYDRETAARHAQVSFQDSGPLSQAYLANGLWAAGHAEEAMQRMDAAVQFAEEINHPFTTVVTYWHAAKQGQLLRDAARTAQRAEQTIAISNELGFAFWSAEGLCSLGASRCLEGQYTEAVEMLERGIDRVLATGADIVLTMAYGFLAESYWRLNNTRTARAALREAFQRVDSEERFFEAELYRIEGEIQLSEDDRQSAHDSFNHSLKVAREQQARSFELRTAVSLARLLQQQGSFDQARALVTASLDSFETAPETADARFAREQLAQL